MKKIIRYMQDTAISYSSDQYSAAHYLGARGKEPQQRARPSKTNRHHTYHAEKRSSHPSAHAHTLPAYTSGARGPYPIPGEVERYQYGSENILQSVEVYVPQRSPHLGTLRENGSGDSSRNSSGSDENATDADTSVKNHLNVKPQLEMPMGTGTHTPTPKYWIVYVHGGYFRDPKVQASSFHPALGQLINPQHEDGHVRSVQQHIQGYASINYRLSPHQGYPQGDEVSNYERREAKWPEQLDDVVSAIKWLQAKYGFGERYLLVGHSVGATLAMLACLNAREHVTATGKKINMTPPLTTLGVCGIYDFQALHDHWGSDYEYLTRNAGMTPETWKLASPALRQRNEYEEKWARGRKRWCLLAQSKSDGLVEWGQVEKMQRVFESEGKEGTEVLVDVWEVRGQHNEVWERGGELARVIALGVGEMMGLDQ